MIVVQLPYPPSTNDIWVRTKRGMRKSDGYSAWLKEAGWMLKQQKAGSVPGKYKLTIEAVRPDKRRRDVDNLIKSVSDALQAFGVVVDDSLCEFVSAQWVIGDAGIRVTVQPAEAA
jgi:crossover junction endodeoxyribonuclease RusA